MPALTVSIRSRFVLLAGAALTLMTAPAHAGQVQERAATPPAKPKLVVMVSVDQFSADLYDQYRPYFTAGLRRLSRGAVFANGYQSHAATETCPGHSTLMTGSRPSRTGIIANSWYDFKGPRPGEVYCAEDERKSDGKDYVSSDLHLRVPTLGERMKSADPRVRTVSVAGKDRAAIMMGGHKMDEIWYWRDGKGFISDAGRKAPRAVEAANAAARAAIAAPATALPLPEWCAGLGQTYTFGTRQVGAGRFERAGGSESQWKASPAFDTAVTKLATDLIRDMKLGHGPATDVLTVSLSATDYVGHTLGTEGTEMCIQVAAVDRAVGELMTALDQTGVDYVIGLSADHGGNDIPERERDRAMPMAARVDAALAPKALGQRIAPSLGWTGGQLLFGGVNGDIWLSPEIKDAALRQRVMTTAIDAYRQSDQVAEVFTAEQVIATPMPTGAPDTWTPLQRQRASYDAERSGQFFVFLKPRITPISTGATGGIATHGSPWDYDRRVPILFWRKGMTRFDQPLSVETVDIMPTFAALVGLKVDPNEIDGRCLDLDNGPADTCAVK